MTWGENTLAKMDIRMDESQDISVWLKEIEDECGHAGIEVIDELGDFTKDEAEKQLKAIKRTGPLYGGRKKHLYEDVVKRKQNKGRTVVVQGGRETRSLWHIVDQGTYRSRPHHFIDRILNKVDRKLPQLLEEKRGKFGD